MLNFQVTYCVKCQLHKAFLSGADGSEAGASKETMLTQPPPLQFFDLPRIFDLPKQTTSISSLAPLFRYKWKNKKFFWKIDLGTRSQITGLNSFSILGMKEEVWQGMEFLRKHIFRNTVEKIRWFYFRRTIFKRSFSFLQFKCNVVFESLGEFFFRCFIFRHLGTKICWNIIFRKIWS